MRLAKSAHTSRPWRIHELTPGFEVEDVWALPTPGGPDDFPRLVEMAASFDPEKSSSRLVRALFAVRWKVGELLGWDETRDFAELYRSDDEWAAEVVNRTVHGVVHLGWVPDGAGAYRGQMAVLVKRNGLLGHAYMAAIKPFRYTVVYPRMLDEFGRAWRAGAG